jgi:type II secretory pathway component PulF
MLEAGLPILRALDTVRRGTSRAMAAALRGIRDQVTRGSTLSEAMGEHERLFPAFDRQIIGAAETSGRLEACLRILAEWYEFQGRIARQSMTGLILPMITITLASFVFPLPRLVLGHIETGGYLTRVLLWLSLFYLPVACLLILYRHAPRRGALRWLFDHALLRVPVLRTGLRELGISRYCRAFNMLYKSGVPIVRALEQATSGTGNMAVSAMFARCPQMAQAGKMASAGFSRRIPQEYGELWQVGEETGELDRMVDKIVEISTDRAELYLSQFSRWLPKLIYGLVMLALIVMILGLARGYSRTIMDSIGNF